MKKTILILSAIVIAGLTNKVSAQSHASKVKSEKADSLEDYRKFKEEAEKKIAENDEKIAELKAKKFDGTTEEREKYNKKIANLEKKNAELRDRVTNYKGDMHDKWNSFKREFNHDMKEMGTALKDLGKNNVK